MDDTAIEVKNISKSFSLNTRGFSNTLKNRKSKKKKFLAVDDVSFNVPKGKMYGIIGLNGSGKTTLLRIIAGIYKPDSGNVTIRGLLAPILHTGAGFNDEFNAKENIITSGIILGMKKSYVKKKVDDIIKFAELEKFANLRLKHYSSGMKEVLAVSSEWQVNPYKVLMDEIVAAGDIHFK